MHAKLGYTGDWIAASRLFLLDVDCWLEESNIPQRIWCNGSGKLRHVYRLILAVCKRSACCAQYFAFF